MVDENQFVVELEEFQLDGHNHNVTVGESYGKMDNATHVINHLNQNHEKKKSKSIKTSKENNFALKD